MRLQKDKIVKQALEVLDRDGLYGVTLRRLAKELDVQAGSLYYHIPDKETLLNEMANAILEEHFSTFDFKNDERDWAQWLDALAHELRAAMLSHREGARVVAGARPNIALMLVKLWDLSVRVLHNNGFSYGKAATITVTLMNFTFGAVIEEQATPPYRSRTDVPLDELRFVGQTFQTLAMAMKAWHEEDNDMHFETGRRIIINGVRAEQDP